MKPEIKFENVSYTYANQKHPALQNVSLTVTAGELKVVTGASGCGKTTLMRLANGLCPQIYGGIVEGRVTVSGLDVSHTPVAELSEVIGTLFQDPEEQFFALSVGDEIAFALRSRGVPAPEVVERTRRAADRLAIGHLLGQDIHALSEGQKQKVGLAAILALGPKVLIFDEPSANLDPESTEALAFTMAELKREGAAILVVDHRLYWLKNVADSVCVMSHGKIIFEREFSVLNNADVRKAWGLRQAEVPDVRRVLPRVRTAVGKNVESDCASFSAQRMSFAYDENHRIFKEASFCIEPGVTALIGDNGTGKTTLARILTGLNQAQGDFFIGGRKVGRDGLMPHAGLVLQNADHQLQMRTVQEEVQSACAAGELLKHGRFELWRRSLGAKDFLRYRGRVDEILARLRLSHLAERHPQSLSGGEKQRVVIACAIAKNPAVLILDEPTSGLDGANMAAIAELLKDEAQKGTAVFLITHDLELMQICDWALDMKSLQSSAA